MAKRISIGSWAFVSDQGRGESEPIADLLARLRELGFDGVELGAHDLSTVDDRDRLKAALAGQGLAISAFVPDLRTLHLLDTRDGAGYVRGFAEACRFAVDLGIGLVCVDTVQSPAVHREDDYRDLLGRLAATWERCIGQAGDLGLRVGWRFDPDRAFNKPADIQRVLERLQQDHFGVVYDTGRAELVAVVGRGQEGKPETLAGGQLELIARLSGRIAHVQLSDSDGSRAGLPLGRGRVDLPLLVPALAKEQTPQGWWTLALEHGPDVREHAAESKAALERVLDSQGR